MMDELNKLLRQLNLYEFHLREYDEPLRRYRNEQREIKNALIETYPHRWYEEEDDENLRQPPPRPVVTRWTPDSSHVRPAIRASLDYLNRKWAPEITKYKRLKAVVRGIKAEIRILTTRRARER